MSGRLLLVSTTPRVPPGLLSWPAWQALREGEVLAGTAGHPQLPYLEEAGVSVEVLAEATDGERARALLDRAGTGRTVAWLAAPDGGELGLMRLLEELVAASQEGAPEVEVIQGSYDLPGARLLDLVATMDRLRSPGGCPWDREQTHASLAPHLLEEAYEAVEAVETGDYGSLREELGDVLLQVAFHSRVAAERDDATGFTIDEVAGEIVGKLVRRHPHVFGDLQVSGADQVKANWDAIKAAERAGENGESSTVDGVPLAQPALSLAQTLQKRAARAGLPAEHAASFADGLGGELFALVARARAYGEDAETLLRRTARAYREHLIELEESRGQ